MPIKASHKYDHSALVPTILFMWYCSTFLCVCVPSCQVMVYTMCSSISSLSCLLLLFLLLASLPRSPPSLPSLLQQHLQVNAGETHLGLHRGQRFINAQEKAQGYLLVRDTHTHTPPNMSMCTHTPAPTSINYLHTCSYVHVHNQQTHTTQQNTHGEGTVKQIE